MLMLEKFENDRSRRAWRMRERCEIEVLLACLFGVALVLLSSYAVGRASEPSAGRLFGGEMLVLWIVVVTVAV